MLDCSCTTFIPATTVPTPPGLMSILGEHSQAFDRLDRGLGMGVSGMGPSAFLPLTPRLWRPTVWSSPPPPPCPPPPPLPPSMPLFQEPCHIPPFGGMGGMSHLFDYMQATARLWYPWYYKGESIFSGGPVALDGYELVNKDLPTRTLKQDRLKERQDLTHTLNIDKDHAAKINAKKSAGTQTQFSSFNGDAPPYPGPPPSYFATHGEPHSADTYSSVRRGFIPPPLTTSQSSSLSSSPSSSGHLVDLSRISPDIQNAPLNLSLSSSLISVHTTSGVRQPRPSVITCASSSLLSSSSSTSSGGVSPQNGHTPNSPSRQEQPVSDPAIEAHFRRSLGNSYADSIPRLAAVPTTLQANISITGSVDDHFAKALGDSTWKAIKSQNDHSLDVFTGSVDDHFAKALGANTWRRIKAETETAENAVTNNNSNIVSTTTTGSSHSSSPLGAPVAT